MLPGFRFAVSAVLASTLLIVMALGLAATVRVAHRQAAGDTVRMLAYDDPAEWGRFFVERRPIATVRADAPAVDSAVPERADAVVPDNNTNAAAISDEPIASIVMPTPQPTTAIVAPAESVLAPEIPVEPGATADAGVPMTPKSNAVKVAVPEVEATGNDPCNCEARKPDGLAAVTPVEEATAVDRVAEVAVSDTQADSAELTTSSIISASRALSPADAGSQEPFVPALEPSERVGGLPAFPNAGPGFVPRDMAAVPVPRSRPAIKPGKPKRKAVAKRIVRVRPPLELTPPTSGFPAPSFDKPWYSDQASDDPSFRGQPFSHPQ